MHANVFLMNIYRSIDFDCEFRYCIGSFYDYIVKYMKIKTGYNVYLIIVYMCALPQCLDDSLYILIIYMFSNI